MSPADQLAAVPPGDPRYRIAQAQLAYWRRRETGWTPARLLAEMPREDKQAPR